MSDLQIIIAATDESGRFQSVIDAALERAGAGGATVILYDVIASGSALTSPRPTIWAGEGEEHEYDHPLDPVDLEKLGRHDFALQVERARTSGTPVFGWLPEHGGGEALALYAAQQHADLIVLPDTEELRGLVDQVREQTKTELQLV